MSASDICFNSWRPVEEPLIKLIPSQTVNRCLSVLSVDSLSLSVPRELSDSVARCPRAVICALLAELDPTLQLMILCEGKVDLSLSLSLLILSQNFFDLLSRVLWERRRGHWKDEICALYITYFSSPPTILLVSRGQPCFCSL